MESVNHTLKIERELSIIELLNTIWHRVINQLFEQLQSASNPAGGQLLTKFCLRLVGESRIWARQNVAQMATNVNGRVTQPDGLVWIVNLDLGTCTCGKYQENSVPCGHAMTCIMQIQQVT